MSEQAVFDALKYHIEVDMRGTRWYRNSMGQQLKEQMGLSSGTRIAWYTAQAGLLLNMLMAKRGGTSTANAIAWMVQQLNGVMAAWSGGLMAKN